MSFLSKFENSINLLPNIGITLSRQVLTTVLTFSFVAILARTLGPEANGQYALVIFFVATLQCIFNLGLAPANIYYVSRGEISAEDAFRSSVYLGIILSFLGLIIGALFIFYARGKFLAEVSETFLFFSLILYPINLFELYFSSILQALQDFRSYNKIIFIRALVNILCGLFLVLLLKLGLYGAILATVVGSLASLTLTLQKLDRLIDLRLLIPSYKDISLLLPYIQEQTTLAVLLIRYGWKAGSSNLVAFFNYKIDIFLIGLILSTSAVGIYVVSVQIVEKLWFLSQAVSTVILPRLSELNGKGDTKSQYELVLEICKIVLLVTTFAAGLLAVASFYFIPILFGIDYKGSVEILWILLPGAIALSFSRILANDIAARGSPENNLYSSLLVLTCNIALNLILIPYYGVLGAAIATTASYIVNSIFKIIVYRKMTSSILP